LEESKQALKSFEPEIWDERDADELRITIEKLNGVNQRVIKQAFEQHTTESLRTSIRDAFRIDTIILQDPAHDFYIIDETKE